MSDEGDDYLDLPAPAEQRITELHVWIATHADGSEGIISGDVEMPQGHGKRHMPMLSSSRGIAEMLEPLVRRARQAADAARPHNKVVATTLVTFVRQP